MNKNMCVCGEGLSRISYVYLWVYSSFSVYFKIPTLLKSDKLFYSCSNVLFFISMYDSSVLSLRTIQTCMAGQVFYSKH